MYIYSILNDIYMCLFSYFFSQESGGGVVGVCVCQTTLLLLEEVCGVEENR